MNRSFPKGDNQEYLGLIKSRRVSVYPSLINVTGRRGMVWMAGDAETALNTGRNRSEVKDHI